MIQYLLGGENIVRRDAREINVRAFLDAGGAPDVLVFSWARASFDRSYKRRKRVFDYFRSLGADSVEFADYSSPTDEIAMKIELSDLVYLTGGIPSVLINRLKTRGVDRMLSKYRGVIVGRSAGTLALCKKGLVTDRNSYAISVIDGIGLIDFVAKVHYIPSDDRILRRLSCEIPLFAISSASAILRANDDMSVIGEAYLFQKGEKKRLTTPFSFGLADLDYG
jgi:peptidase E